MFQLEAGKEPIAGYQLVSRLGAGGYGEVWKVTAPGDLAKAIKFVYGRMDDVRAARELKALSRIKQVRHPFLLSLERFEIINGQLVIVTELAEMSLLERYEHFRKTGLQGIPRDELLMHIRDAADALDFMSENHGLQHLDIKPENLLLVGGRVKVADFGLVKDLLDGMATLIGGVTPVYAAPEAFDGRASRFSDQYSLAITYQEMLTGVRPFPGTTAAQLAIQHTSSPPLLSPLSTGDRPTIARALSKTPEHRFGSSREMVDALQRVNQVQAAAPESVTRTPVISRAKEEFDEGSVTMAAKPGAAPQPQQRPVSDTRPASRPIAATKPDKTLPPIEFSTEGHGFRPTIFIGVGGTGASTMRRLRQRLVDRFVDLSRVPSFQLLLLDTDPRESYRSGGEGIPALEPAEVLSLPLRRSQDYRKECDKILGWLSRRWLYNIPRSQLTEGLRPLGRLALIDHISQVFERLTHAISLATTEASLTATQNATGFKLRSTTPRVWIVGAISGGTGGGMVIDLAYMARQILRSLQLSEGGVAGLLAHATNRNTAAKDLARSNAYATLSELAHFQNPDVAYPGDHLCGLAAFTSDVSPFAEQYLVHLGDDLNENEFQSACDSLAEYLSLDAGTRCGDFLDHCRDSVPAEANESPTPSLRTFGMHRIHIPKQSAVSVAADLICKRTIDRWRGDMSSGRAAALSPARAAKEAAQPQKPQLLETAEIDALAAEFAETLGLAPTADRLTARLLATAEAELGTTPEALVAQIVTKLSAQGHAADPHQLATEAINLIEGVLASLENEDEAPKLVTTPLEQAVDQLAAELEHAVAHWLLQLLESPRGRFRAAIRGGEWFTHHLLSLQQSESTAIQRVQQQRAGVAQQLIAPASPAVKPRKGAKSGTMALDDKLLATYFRLRLQEVALARTRHLVSSAHGHLVWLAEQVVQARRRLNEFDKKWQASVEALHTAGRTTANLTTVWYGKSTNFAEAVAAIVDSLGPDFLVQFDCELQRDLLAPQGGLHSAASSCHEQESTLWADLRAAARAAVNRALSGVDAAKLLLDSSASPQAAADSLPKLLHSAVPRLRGVGGFKRSVVLLPVGAAGRALHQRLPTELTASATTLFDPYEDIVLLQELQQLPLVEVAEMLIDGRRDYADIAQRTMTRVDIYWNPLQQQQQQLLNGATLVRS